MDLLLLGSILLSIKLIPARIWKGKKNANDWSLEPIDPI